MEYFSFKNIADIGFKDLKNSVSPSQHFFAEIIVIDKTQPALSPAVFQLKETALTDPHALANYRNGFLPLQADDFIPLGEMLSINKKSKMITLTNQNLVSYQHLITANATKHTYLGPSQNPEFLTAIQTFIDAFRVQKKIPEALKSLQNRSNRPKTHKTSQHHVSAPSKSIEKIAHDYMLKDDPNGNHCGINGPDKCLYEVEVSKNP